MDISIEGLSKKQRAYADILWSLNGTEEVSRFVSSLPPAERREATTVMTLMIWAFLDQVEDIELAEKVLKKYLWAA